MFDDQKTTDSKINGIDSRPSYLARRKIQKQLKIKTVKEKRKKPVKEKSKSKSSASIWGALSSLITLCLIVVLVIVGSWVGVTQLFEASNDVELETTFQVRPGDDLTHISERLENQKLILNQDIYRYLVAWEGNDTRLKAGNYKIPANSSMRDIMNIFVEGQSIQHKLTFAEGLTTAQILNKLKNAPLLTGEIKLTPAEGSLLPETYLYESGLNRNNLIKQMQEAQKKFLANLWGKHATDLPLSSIEEVVILASIVEKETGLAKERPEVAAVFINRLKKKMRLQSDPTIIYGITKGQYKLDRSLRKSEIKAKTAYNTYQIKGLPPTPISNPGKASILAVLNPAKVDYIFFVADGTGGHVFAKTYKQHQK
ncbi:MAG: endolytic transglycosylase MltG, partial [Rhizobiales bacterium]|nr:endolytic transglycosylase MltG [Hyphomicrobiales bacterium]